MSNVNFFCKIFSVILISTIHCFEDDTVYCTINTNSGRIRGQQNRTLFDKTPYFSFRGIPFAKPPIDNLRFKVCDIISSREIIVINTILHLKYKMKSTRRCQNDENFTFICIKGTKKN